MKYDLEERTLKFAKDILLFCKNAPQTIINKNLVSQLVRSASAVGANYREANDVLGRKDFVLRVRIARKEAKETIYWLELFLASSPDLSNTIQKLLDECNEFKNVLSAIIKSAQ